MDEQMFATPPMSGEKIPFKDIPEEMKTTPQTPQQQVKNPVNPQQDKKLKTMKLSIIILAVGMFFIVIILLLVMWQMSQKKTGQVIVEVTPTPEPSATPKVESVLPQELVDQVGRLNDDIGNLDLQELDLSYPQLDMEIKY